MLKETYFQHLFPVFESWSKMPLRKFMHPRNKYKEEPNFKKLAILYPEFRKIAVADISGKVKLNFKDAKSLTVLTQTLLKHDFDIDIDIPPKNLVPALPLRLNYILWIEDLLKHGGTRDLSTIQGIDIGTGATCIYSILLSKIYGIKMMATDIDSDSINSARSNIEKNNLENLVKVVLVKRESILRGVIEEDETWNFVMCNPPFFKTDKGLGKKLKQEPPRNAPTGNDNELQVTGGETEFILHLVEESMELKDKVRIYTTMFGQKSSLTILRNELLKKKILNTTWTEFCQGFTKRWGVAWSLLPKDQIDLTTATVIRTRSEVQKIKKQRSIEIIFPARDAMDSLDQVVNELKDWLTELKIEMKEIELEEEHDYPCWVCQLTCYKDTWTHSRRKRRMALRQETLKKQRTDNFESYSDYAEVQLNTSESLEDENISTQNTDPLLVCTLLVSERHENETDGENNQESDQDSVNNEKKLRICMVFDSGDGGKLSLESLRQYLVNKLNIRKFFNKQSPSKLNKKRRKKKKKMETNNLSVAN